MSFLQGTTILTFGFPFLGLNSSELNCQSLDCFFSYPFHFEVHVASFFMLPTKGDHSQAHCYQFVIASFRRAWHSLPMLGKPGLKVPTGSYQPVNHWSSLALWNLFNVTLGSSVPGSLDEVQDRATRIGSIPGGGVGNMGL